MLEEQHITKDNQIIENENILNDISKKNDLINVTFLNNEEDIKTAFIKKLQQYNGKKIKMGIIQILKTKQIHIKNIIIERINDNRNDYHEHASTIIKTLKRMTNNVDTIIIDDWNTLNMIIGIESHKRFDEQRHGDKSPLEIRMELIENVVNFIEKTKKRIEILVNAD